MSGSQAVTVSGISGKEQIFILIEDAKTNSNVTREYKIYINADRGNLYTSFGNRHPSPTSYSAQSITGYKRISDSEWGFAESSDNANSVVNGAIYINGGTGTGTKFISSVGGGSGATGKDQAILNLAGFYAGTAAITSVTVYVTSANFNGGTMYVYGSAN